jgi:predicted transcriptional regulator
MSDPNPIDLVFFRGLKGAPASILLLLIFTQQPLHRHTIETATGYSDKPIAAALALLERCRMIAQSENGFVLAKELSRKISDFEASSSSVQIRLSDEIEREDEEEEQQASRNYSETITWLTRAGIGRRSPKLAEIIATEPDPSHIKAWVLYLEWWTREAERYPGAVIDGRQQFSVGTLITVLLDGDPTPEVRCSQCLEEDRNCYCGLVKR